MQIGVNRSIPFQFSTWKKKKKKENKTKVAIFSYIQFDFYISDNDNLTLFFVIFRRTLPFLSPIPLGLETNDKNRGSKG